MIRWFVCNKCHRSFSVVVVGNVVCRCPFCHDKHVVPTGRVLEGLEAK